MSKLFEPIPNGGEGYGLPGQIALLMMPCGRVHKCVWEIRYSGSLCTGMRAWAWWPYRRKGECIALYQPKRWMLVGTTDDYSR